MLSFEFLMYLFSYGFVTFETQEDAEKVLKRAVQLHFSKFLLSQITKLLVSLLVP